MGKVIEAVYENGVFKPLEKVDLRDSSGNRDKGEDIKRFVKTT